MARHLLTSSGDLLFDAFTGDRGVDALRLCTYRGVGDTMDCCATTPISLIGLSSPYLDGGTTRHLAGGGEL